MNVEAAIEIIGANCGAGCYFSGIVIGLFWLPLLLSRCSVAMQHELRQKHVGLVGTVALIDGFSPLWFLLSQLVSLRHNMS